MPFLLRRYDWMKVYRPTGAAYADGQTLPTPELAVASAVVAFAAEFKREPRPAESIIEVLGVTGGWAATIFEFKDRDSSPKQYGDR